MFFFSSNVFSAIPNPPFLAFSDLISGPDTGIGDSKGSGVIVTIWGQNLRSNQGESKVFFIDSTGTEREAAYVYYWKNADGSLPGGPSNLYKSHKMQEVAFSIPDSAENLGGIKLIVNGVESNILPFTVRLGDILHVKSTGNDQTADGSWGNPYLTVNKAVGKGLSGSTIYIHDVMTGGIVERGIYWNNGKASSSLDAQFSIASFPGYQANITAQHGIEHTRVEGLVVSKLDIYSSNYKEVDSLGQPTGGQIDNTPYATYGMKLSKNGRAVGNRIGDIPGMCASATAGAIIGGGSKGVDKISNTKIFGNEIYDYGCNGSSKLHHTTYLTIRSNPYDLQVEPWEWGYNYLHGGKAKFGIHQFDYKDGCGNVTGPLRIHHNVIVDQAGAGISIGSECGWSMDAYIENNVLINVGLAAAWDGLDVNTSDGPENGGINIRDAGVNGLSGTMYIRNNLIYKYSEDGQTNGGRGCINLLGKQSKATIIVENNICYTTTGSPFVSESVPKNVSGSNNVWYSELGGHTPPTWDGQAIAVNPDISLLEHARVQINSSRSPLINNALSQPQLSDVDINGFKRGGILDIGPIEYILRPNPPYSLKLN